MLRSDPHWGLYLITDEAMLADGTLLPFLRGALDAGVRVVQLRAKSASKADLRAAGTEIRRLTREHKAVFIVNDRIDLAAELEADGVHLGQMDDQPEEARRVLGPEAIVGLSTHNESQILDACDRPVDYIGVGPVFTTATKPKAGKPVGMPLIRWACSHSSRPFVAIGGITLANLGEVLQAGARNVAVVSAISRGPDPAGAAREFIRRIRTCGHSRCEK
ncbi:thiamine phosphate synthase [Candidatus Sumerlaeota bacterium]|nr:thiamine phosphate synthase [Candidatus Sumerlaeota bacterium]